MPLAPRQLKTLRTAPVGDAGNRLGEAIKLAAISQADLSREIGMSQQYVSDVVSGRYQTITVDNARRFADFFGCAIEDLFPSRQEALRA